MKTIYRLRQKRSKMNMKAMTIWSFPALMLLHFNTHKKPYSIWIIINTIVLCTLKISTIAMETTISIFISIKVCQANIDFTDEVDA